MCYFNLDFYSLKIEIVNLHNLDPWEHAAL